MVLKVFRFDASGCNGCDIEILSAIFNSEYEIIGIEVVDAPEKAQAMIVTGGGNEKTAILLKDAQARLQNPKLVIAMGACAASMCVFKEGYNMRGPVDSVIPVSYFVLGCPPRPQNLAIAVQSLLNLNVDHTGSIWTGPEGLRSKMAHDSEKCTACGACANMCPSGAIDITEFEGKYKIVYHLWKCSFCGTCQQVCPEEAVKLTSEYRLQGAEKAPLAVSDEMARMKCSVCGSFHITFAQNKAVKARILVHRPELANAAAQIDSSLSTCPGCKAQPPRQTSARKDMRRWAYNL